MSFEFLMFQMVPDFLVWVPVWGIRWQVENMETLLTLDETSRFLGSMRRRFIHDDNKVPASVMSKELFKKCNYVIRGDPFLEQAKDKLTALGNGRHR